MLVRHMHHLATCTLRTTIVASTLAVMLASCGTSNVDRVSDVALTPSTVRLGPTDTTTLTADLATQGDPALTLTWTSDDPTVATLTPTTDRTATVTALSPGDTTLHAISDATPDARGTTTLTVAEPPTTDTTPEPGDATAIVDGEPARVDVSAGDERVTIGTGNVDVDVAATANGDDPLDVPADGVLHVPSNADVVLEGAGLAPDTLVDVWLTSEPTLLGTTRAEADGSFAADVSVPSDEPRGAHTLRLTGTTRTNDPIQLDLGLEIVGPTTQPTILDVTISGGDQTLPLDTTTTLHPIVTTLANAPDTVTWSTSDTTIATIDPTGTATAHAGGYADITAQSTFDPTQTDTITLAVPTIETITLTPSDLLLATDTTYEIQASVDARGGADPTLQWATNDPDVATIDDDGTLTTTGIGTTTITARSIIDPDVTATTTVRTQLERFLFCPADTTSFVAPDGNDTNAGTPTHPYATIQHAIDASNDGDTVCVAAGTYVEKNDGTDRGLDISTVDLSLVSADGRDTTVLDADGASDGIHVRKNLDAFELRGFTVQGFTNNGVRGRGYRSEGTTLRLFDNRIQPASNQIQNGIQVTGDRSIVRGNDVRVAPFTPSWLGSGITIAGGHDVAIAGNEVAGSGGVGIGVQPLAVPNSSDPAVRDIEIRDNTTSSVDVGILLSAFSGSVDGVRVHRNRITVSSTGNAIEVAYGGSTHAFTGAVDIDANVIGGRFGILFFDTVAFDAAEGGSIDVHHNTFQSTYSGVTFQHDAGLPSPTDEHLEIACNDLDLKLGANEDSGPFPIINGSVHTIPAQGNWFADHANTVGNAKDAEPVDDANPLESGVDTNPAIGFQSPDRRCR